MTAGGASLPSPTSTPGAPPALVLASRSPRRQEALAALGVPFETVVSHAEERIGPLADPTDPIPIALAKALDVVSQRPTAVVLAGDTIVDLDGAALGKPDGPSVPDAAGAMLRRLRGQRHAVRSAVVVVPQGEAEVRACEVASPVFMRDYSDAEIERYVATGEPFDCAGAYDVHRLGGALVSAVEGCFGAVVGLPVVAAATLLGEAGIAVTREPATVCSELYGRSCLAGRPETARRCLPARRTRQGR